jgi:GH24 family phage-related lysozyme (muramidase)
MSILDRRRVLLGLSSAVLLTPIVPYSNARELSLEETIQDLEQLEEPPIGADASLEAKELFSSGFAAATPPIGKSKTPISSQSVRFIIAYEIVNAATYERRYSRPIWPKRRSGVTIGIGYDLGYASKQQFQNDWVNYISSDSISVLSSAIGKKNTAARDIVAELQDVRIPFVSAHAQFLTELLPRYVALTEASLSNTRMLSPLSLGALVSLTFNRGPAYDVASELDPKGRFEEMRSIKRLMSAQKFSQIPAEIRSMTRIWANEKDSAGLIPRRQAEAKMFEIGLS